MSGKRPLLPCILTIVIASAGLIGRHMYIYIYIYMYNGAPPPLPGNIRYSRARKIV